MTQLTARQRAELELLGGFEDDTVFGAAPSSDAIAKAALSALKRAARICRGAIISHDADYVKRAAYEAGVAEALLEVLRACARSNEWEGKDDPGEIEVPSYTNR